MHILSSTYSNTNQLELASTLPSLVVVEKAHPFEPMLVETLFPGSQLTNERDKSRIRHVATRLKACLPVVKCSVLMCVVFSSRVYEGWPITVGSSSGFIHIAVLNKVIK